MDNTILDAIERRSSAHGRRASDCTDILPLVMGGAGLLLLGFLLGISL